MYDHDLHNDVCLIYIELIDTYMYTLGVARITLEIGECCGEKKFNFILLQIVKP